MAAIVHMATSMMVMPTEREESIKARIQLSIGALNVLGEAWPLARTVKKQMLEIYQEIARHCV